MPSNFPDDGRPESRASVIRVVVRIYPSRSTADLAAASLEARGIRCWTTTDDGGGLFPALANAAGVKLCVLSTDAQAAEALLDADGIPGDLPPPPETDETPVLASSDGPRKRISIGALVAGVILGVLLCLLYQWAGRQGETEYRDDFNGDGLTDVFWVYRNGYVSKAFRDRNFDGKWDAWEVYDEHGRCTSSRVDNNFDGRPDGFGAYSNGVIVRDQWDTDFNGTPDVTHSYKHELPLWSEWRPNNSELFSHRDDYTNGVLLQTSRDIDGDGKFDEVIRYDSFQNPVKTNFSELVKPL